MLDIIIITGASRGMGASIANKCSALTTKLIGIGSSEKIHDLSLNNLECEYVPLQLDLINYNKVKQKISYEISKTNPKSIGIVLCGAQLGQYAGLFDDDLANWDKLYKCNVLGNLAVIQGCHAQLKNGSQCKIAFFAGGGGASSYIDFSGYALTKAASIRAVENLSEEFKKLNYNASIIAVAPGAVDTDMLTTIFALGGTVKTRTSIEEPTNFIFHYLNGEFDKQDINGRFLHVRDDIKTMDFSNKDKYKLRRIV